MSYDQENHLRVQKFKFNSTIFSNLENNFYAENFWPIVYVLNNGNSRLAYVGETTDVNSRMNAHLKNNSKNTLNYAYLINSNKFNKSATLDIESNLIKYMVADGKFKLLNGNMGLANHNYYQKNEIYWEIFKTTWDKLRAHNVVQHSIEHIDNSDLFKYSPYKSLSTDQQKGLIMMLESLLDDNYDNIVIEGGAGTGKTILAVFLMKILKTDTTDYSLREFGDNEIHAIKLIQKLKVKYPDPKVALVVPMSSFRKTLKKVFKNIHGLSQKMVIGPSEVSKEEFDILMVDESHRLRQRINLGSYFKNFDDACKRLDLDNKSCSEVDWVLKQSQKSLFFYDESQSIKPSDANKVVFDNLKKEKSTKVEKLISQFRVQGGNAYIKRVTDILNCNAENLSDSSSIKNYEFLIFDSIDDLIRTVTEKNGSHKLSRLIAGFSWKWISKAKKNRHLYDIEIENTKLRWNTTNIDWINKENSVNEVGCIHTTQGYDLNYSGVIFGNEITYDKSTNTISILKENYYDKNGKQTIKNPEDLKNYILNIYKTIMLRGIKGTFVYACDPGLREYLMQHIPVYKREKTENVKNVVQLVSHEDVKPYVNAIPLYDLKVAAGDFGSHQEVSDVSWVKCPDNVKISEDLFACTVIGESMNKVIPNGSVCLFKKYTGGSREGLIVLVELLDSQDADTELRYTVKEYSSKKFSSSDGWRHVSVTLTPLSVDDNFSKINLVDNVDSKFRVIGIFHCLVT